MNTKTLSMIGASIITGLVLSRIRRSERKKEEEQMDRLQKKLTQQFAKDLREYEKNNLKW